MISQRAFIGIHIDSDQPLYKRIEDAMAGISGAALLPSPTREQIDEMFAPQQTIEEREISRKFNSGWNAVWLRTCYKPSMAQRYFELARLAGADYEGGCVESLNHVLDDHSLYDFQGSEQGVLDQLLLRMPGLTDGSGIMDEYGDGSELVHSSAIYQSEREGDVRDVGNRVQNYVYVADEEAIEKSRVKIWWFDEFGEIVWDNYTEIPDSDLDGLRGASMDGQGFLEIVGEDGKRGDRIDR
jgi:hypothetical protein